MNGKCEFKGCQEDATCDIELVLEMRDGSKEIYPRELCDDHTGAAIDGLAAVDGITINEKARDAATDPDSPAAGDQAGPATSPRSRRG